MLKETAKFQSILQFPNEEEVPKICLYNTTAFSYSYGVQKVEITGQDRVRRQCLEAP